jgi:hypothetical protein
MVIRLALNFIKYMLGRTAVFIITISMPNDSIFNSLTCICNPCLIGCLLWYKCILIFTRRQGG